MHGRQDRALVGVCVSWIYRIQAVMSGTKACKREKLPTSVQNFSSAKYSSSFLESWPERFTHYRYISIEFR